MTPAITAGDEAADAAAWIARATVGDLEGAWRVSDRIRNRTHGLRDEARPRHLQQIWDGRPFDGRRVLIRCYHGLGDTIQFIRYAPLVRTVAREVVVWAQPRLLPVLRTAPGIDRLMPLHDGTPACVYDVDVESMELPYAFRSTLTTIPSAVPYLHVAPMTSPPEDRLAVGIMWRGGDWNLERSIPFPMLDPLFAVPGVSWYQLQGDPGPGERHPRLGAHDCSTVLQTARWMRALDLVIAIDSMPAHLAGALGVPVWTLLTSHPDWRWLERRSDSPWYPTMRLFRQYRAGQWLSVIEDVRQALERTVVERGRAVSTQPSQHGPGPRTPPEDKGQAR
jgi:hypothetical protein